jgi:iron complex transport system ATP-binding protein
MTALLEASNLAVSLGRRPVLDDVAFALDPGETVGLVGPNGAGKTTLLRALAGVLKPVRGEVRLEGQPVGSLPHGHFAARVAYLPQGGGSYWAVPVRTLVMLGRLPHRERWSKPETADERAVDTALAATGVEHLAERPVTELSGGERARVLLARALAGEPQLLLADEPVSGLDPYHRLEVMDHLRALSHAGKAVVVVLHDLTLAARFCDRLVLLADGKVAASGPPEDVLTPQRLDSVYRVRAVLGRQGGEPFVVPWDRLGDKGDNSLAEGTG